MLAWRESLAQPVTAAAAVYKGNINHQNCLYYSDIILI
jgi:hypothetical protein